MVSCVGCITFGNSLSFYRLLIYGVSFALGSTSTIKFILTMPDIDSLSQSFSSSRPYSNGTHPPSPHSPSRHASSSSLAAAATINAGFQNEESRHSSISSNRGRPSPQVSRSERERRRSNAFLGSYDPTLPGPGELQVGDLRGHSHQGTNFPLRAASPQAIGSPPMGAHRDRAPSLGELHQELEAEQEAQVVSRYLEILFIRHIWACFTDTAAYIRTAC